MKAQKAQRWGKKTELRVCVTYWQKPKSKTPCGQWSQNSTNVDPRPKAASKAYVSDLAVKRTRMRITRAGP
jgi:hypothetical protein